MNVTLPVKLPVPVGANVTLSAAVPPDGSVSGNDKLLVANPAPLNVAWLTVISLPPVFDRVKLLVWLDPTLIVPNATDDELSDSCPEDAVVPEAVSDTRTLEFVPSREMVVDKFSDDDGRNCTWKGTLAPAARTIGAVIPMICRSGVGTVIALTLTAEDVLFVSVFGRALLVPTGTVPKSSVVVVTAILPPPEPAPDKLWQPVRNNELTTVRNRPSQTLRNR